MTSTEMFVEIRAKLDKLQSDLKKGKREFDLFGKTVTRIGGMLAGLFAVTSIINYTKKASELAATTAEVADGFKRIGNEATLNELRKSVKGTVSDLDLMKAAVKAESYGIPLKHLAGYFEFAERKAGDLGLSTSDAVRQIVDGVGNKSTRALKDLGISAVVLQKEFHGIPPEMLSVAEVSKKMSNLVIVEMDKMGENVASQADKIDAQRVAWENAQASIGKTVLSIQAKLAPALTELANNLKLVFDYGIRGARIHSKALYEVNKSIDESSQAYLKLGRAKDEDEAKQMAINSQLKMYTAYLEDSTIGDDGQRKIWESKVGILTEMASGYNKVTTSIQEYTKAALVPIPEIPAIVEPDMEFPDIKEWNPNELMFDEAGAKELETYSKGIDKIGESLQEVKLQTNNTSSAFSGLGQNIAQIWSDGIEGSESFADAIKQSIKATIKALIAEGLTAVISKALETYPPPASLAIAAASGAAAGALMYGVSKFEKGGIVGGSTFSGDTQLIRANSGEMILNHRQQANLLALANGSGSGIPHTIILKAQGNDLVGVIDRTNKYYSRTR